MNKYRFGFSLKGFISFMLIMVPNIIWMIAPTANDILAGNNAANLMYDIVLNVSRWLMFALLILLINKAGYGKKQAALFSAATLCLVGYYILWVCYFTGVINPWFVVGMAVLPSMYFIFVELWMKNFIAVIPTVVFGITHIAITSSNYLL